jgi:hypothetical protein
MDPSEDLEHLARVESAADAAALPASTTSVFVIRLDDRVAETLGQLPALRSVYQDGAPTITDRGLAALSGLRHLQVLDLEHAELITDAGLVALAQLSNLEWLDLGDCSRVTDAGLAKLRSRLPDCEIER